MNRTVVICFGLALFFETAISQTNARAQSLESDIQPLKLSSPSESSTEPRVSSEREESESAPNKDQESNKEYLQSWQTTEVDQFSPRAVLDLSTTERTPEQSSAGVPTTGVDLFVTRSIKEVEIANDRFYHRTIPFEEPLHERFGISHNPPVQLVKSTFVFFGKSIVATSKLVASTSPTTRL